MSDAVVESNSNVFRRLMRMLRPHYGAIAVALILLLASMPGELFPGMVWMYAVDHLIRHDDSIWTRWMHRCISFGGRVDKPLALLASAVVVWMYGVYLLSLVLGTISSNLMNRVAQKF